MSELWETEGDERDFEAHGLKCAMRRGPVGQWCGYVGIPEGHPLFGEDCDAVSVDVHGGLTYADDNLPSSWKLKIGRKSLYVADGWWFGFDCAHAGDLMPEYRAMHPHGYVYRDAAYVEHECRNLARQLAEWPE